LVAFIDDDAVPEPGWLHHLAAVFADQDIAAAGGYVRGRNGISYQYSGQIVDALGASTPLRHSGDAPTVIEGRPGQTLKTIGTNSAFRRNVLVKLGGFNPAFAYYLDETGACEPNDIKRLLETFDAGVAACRSRPLSSPAKITLCGTQFVNIWRSGVSRRHKILSGFRIHQKSLRRKARTELRSGSVVSLYIFSRTALFHKVRFHPDGYWEQSGGLFGRANRSDSIFEVMTMAKRVEKEDCRVAAARHP